MFTGKCFALRRAVMALESVGSKEHATTLIAGTMLIVKSGPSITNNRVTVECSGKEYVMFAIDLRERADEVDCAELFRNVFPKIAC